MIRLRNVLIIINTPEDFVCMYVYSISFYHYFIILIVWKKNPDTICKLKKLLKLISGGKKIP